MRLILAQDGSHYRSTNSFDGRYYGPVARGAILGKAVSIYAPAARKRRLD